MSRAVRPGLSAQQPQTQEPTSMSAVKLISFSKSLLEVGNFAEQIPALEDACLATAQALDGLETRLIHFATASDAAELPHEYIPHPEHLLGADEATGPLPLDNQLDPVVNTWLSAVPSLAPGATQPSEAGKWSSWLPGFLRAKPRHVQGSLFSTRAAMVQHMVEPLDLYLAVLDVAKERLLWLTAQLQQTVKQEALHAVDKPTGQETVQASASAIADAPAAPDPAATSSSPAAPVSGAVDTSSTPSHAPAASLAQQEALLASSITWLVKSAPSLRALAAHVLYEMRKAAVSYKVPSGLLQPLPPQLLVRPPSTGSSPSGMPLTTPAASTATPEVLLRVQPTQFPSLATHTNTTQAIQPDVPPQINTYLPTNLKTHKEPLRQLMAGVHSDTATHEDAANGEGRDLTARAELGGVREHPAGVHHLGLLPGVVDGVGGSTSGSPVVPTTSATRVGTSGVGASGSPPGNAAGGTQSVLLGAAQLPVLETSQG